MEIVPTNGHKAFKVTVELSIAMSHYIVQAEQMTRLQMSHHPESLQTEIH